MLVDVCDAVTASKYLEKLETYLQNNANQADLPKNFAFRIALLRGRAEECNGNFYGAVEKYQEAIRYGKEISTRDKSIRQEQLILIEARAAFLMRRRNVMLQLLQKITAPDFVATAQHVMSTVTLSPVLRGLQLTSALRLQLNQKSPTKIAPSPITLYLLAVNDLKVGKPREAFDILTTRRVSEYYNRNFTYWLRLAECCIAIHAETTYRGIEHTTLPQYGGTITRENIASVPNAVNTLGNIYGVLPPQPPLSESFTVAGKGPLRKIILPDASSHVTNSEAITAPPTDTSKLLPTISTAIYCCGIAFQQAAARKHSFVINCVTLCQSYCYGVSGDWFSAFKSAELSVSSMVKGQQIGSKIQILAKLYGAEAFFHQNDMERAESLLTSAAAYITSSGSNSITPDSFPLDAVMNNLAYCKICKGDIEGARTVLKKYFEMSFGNTLRPVSPHLFRQLVWLDLITDEAKGIARLFNGRVSGKEFREEKSQELQQRDVLLQSIYVDASNCILASFSSYGIPITQKLHAYVTQLYSQVCQQLYTLMDLSLVDFTLVMRCTAQNLCQLIVKYRDIAQIPQNDLVQYIVGNFLEIMKIRQQQSQSMQQRQ